MTTLAELEAQQAALDLAKASYSRPFIDSANAALSAEATAGLRAVLQASFDGLPAGDVKTQLGNALSVFAFVPTRIAEEAQRLALLLDGTAAP